MPRRYPTYPKKPHASGRARIQWAPFFGKGIDHYLAGDWDSDESRAEFNEIITRIDRERAAKRTSVLPAKSSRLYVGGLISIYRQHAESNYKRAQFDKVRVALRVANEVHGETPAEAFGSPEMHQVQDAMVKRGWARSYVNQEIGCLKKMYKWAAKRGHVSQDAFARLALVEPLQEGETQAPERPKVRAVPLEHVKLVLPYLSPTVADMVRLHFIQGIRSDELTGLRLCELNRSHDVWIYRKEFHKTRRKKKEKVVCFGPQAQRILQPYIERAVDFIFTPSQSVAEHAARRAAGRNGVPLAVAKESKQRECAARYTTRSYQKAIVHGFLRYAKENKLGECPRKFNEKTKRWSPVAPKAWLISRGVPYWHPHQLRHARTTITAEQFGIREAMAQIGNTLQATQIYNEESLSLALKVARETRETDFTGFHAETQVGPSVPGRKVGGRVAANQARLGNGFVSNGVNSDHLKADENGSVDP